MKYKIEKNIPLSLIYDKYPFDKMAIGDSFFIVLDKNKSIMNLRSYVHMSFLRFRKITPSYEGLKIRVLKQKNNGVDGLRVWLLKK